MNYWIICDLPIMCLAINIINILYNIAGSSLALSFFRYSQVVFGVETIGGRKKRRIVSKKLQLMGACMSIYALAVAAFDAFAYKTDWFLIRKSGSFDYGPLDILWYVSVYLPMVVSLVFGIKLFFDKKHYSSREKYLPINIFGLLIAIMAVIQMTVNDSYPIIPMGITMALVFMFITNSEVKVSCRKQDARINRFNEYNASSGKMYKLMVSIGYAKYGEVENDSARALINRADKMLYKAKVYDKR